MLIVRHLGTPNSDFNGCHCMRDPVLYRSMVQGHPEPLMISKYSGTIASTSSPVEALSSCNR